MSLTFLFYVDVDFKKILENVLRFETDVVLGVFCLSRFHYCERTHDAGSVMRISFQYKLMGFRINFFESDFCVHYYITVGQSTVVRQQHLSEFAQ